MKPLRVLSIVLSLCVICLAEPDPRSHLIIDPLPRTLGNAGFLLTAGPALNLVHRENYWYDSGSTRTPGPSTRLYGFGVEVSRDMPDLKGRDHLVASLGASMMPGQSAFLDNTTDQTLQCNFFHFKLGLALGRSALPVETVRPYFLFGPTLNLMLWQKHTVLQQLSWGVSARTGALFTWKKRKWVVEAEYGLASYLDSYPDAFLDVREYSHSFSLRAGPAF